MKRVVAVVSMCCAVVMTACGGAKSGSSDSTAGKAPAAAAATGGDLTGAGSTFAYPLYSRWASDYATKAGVRVNYQAIGSGGGIRQLSEMTVDFGATDGPMSDDEMSKAKGGAILHVPTALGGVVLAYNLPAVGQPLKLDGDAVAGIFLGTITKWNDAKLAALNPGVTLPKTDIVVVHRSDGSGTTFVFTDYLSTVSPAWAKAVGKGKDVKWPVGLGGKGNDGVSGQVRQTPGAVGYVELAYANQTKMSVAALKNSSGVFIAPNVASITAAASGVAAKLPANTDYRISIVNAPGATAYPISSFTWILLYRVQPDAAKGKKLVDFVRWGLSDGQALETALDYAPLPEAMLAGLRQRLDSIKVGAK